MFRVVTIHFFFFLVSTLYTSVIVWRCVPVGFCFFFFLIHLAVHVCVRAACVCSIKRKINRKRQNETISYTRRQKSLFSIENTEDRMIYILFYHSHSTIYTHGIHTGIYHIEGVVPASNTRERIECRRRVCVHASLGDGYVMPMPGDTASRSSPCTRNVQTSLTDTHISSAFVSFDLFCQIEKLRTYIRYSLQETEIRRSRHLSMDAFCVNQFTLLAY